MENNLPIKVIVLLLLSFQNLLAFDLNGTISAEVICLASSNNNLLARLDVTVDGGYSPFDFQWSTGETTEDIEVTEHGTYTVTVTDALCGKAILEVLFERPIDVNLVSVIPSTTPISNDGSIDISYTYTSPPYSFQWSNGATTEDISNLAPGTYSVTVTDGDCGIGTYDNINIAACKGGVSFNFTIDETHFNASNQNSNNGSIDITVNGVSEGNYQYLWTNNTTQQSISQDEDINGLDVGFYTVVVTDACGRTAELTVEITSCSLVVDHDVVEPCMGASNGEIDLSFPGAGVPTGLYTFQWSNGEVTSDIDGLAAGTYYVTITGNSCSVVYEVRLDSAPSDIEITAEVIDACLNGVGGGIDLTVTGGDGFYTYEWSTGETTEDVSDLPFGNYSVNVSDGEGCSNFEFYSITIRQIDTEAAIVGQCNASEKDGSINLTINDLYQLGPYTFQWSNGETTQNINGLGAGDYFVTITDGDGCSDTYSYNIELLDINPLDLTNPFYTQYATITDCSSGSNGSIAFNPFPSFSEYPESISVWTNSDESIVGYGNEITNLAPGEYCVIIYPSLNSSGEGEGCVLAEGCFTIDESSIDVGVYTITNPEKCEEYYYGSLGLSLSYEGSSVSIQGTGPNFQVSYGSYTGTSIFWNNLEVGDYYFTISDGSSCPVEIEVKICCCKWDQQSDGNAPDNWCNYPTNSSPSQEDLEVSLENILHIEPNNGTTTGSIDISTNLPNPLTYYSWTGPNGFTSFDQDISNLEEGEYCVSVSTGCGSSVYKCWNIVDCANLDWNIVDDNTDDCPGTNAGIIDVSNSSVDLPSGVTTDLSFALLNNNTGSVINSTDGFFENLNVGSYTVAIFVQINSDSDFMCETSKDFVIEESEPDISFTYRIGDTCPGLEYGSIELFVQAEFDDITYNWSMGGNGSAAYTLGEDSYDITITDGRGCSIIAGPFMIGSTNQLEEEYEEFRSDCIKDYTCNEQHVLGAQENLIATEGYDENDCRYYEYWCESDGEYYYPFGEGSERVYEGYDEDVNLETCVLTRTCKNDEVYEVIYGIADEEHFSDCDGGTSSDCCYCFTAKTCLIMVNDDVHTRHIDITNHLSVNENPEISTDPCDPDEDGDCCSATSPSTLNCEVTVKCIEEDGSESILLGPICVDDCSVQSHSFICSDEEQKKVVDLFTGSPESRESTKENIIISKADGSFSVKAYPNPFESELFIEIDSDKDMSLNFKIIDVLGRVTKELNITISKGLSVTSLESLVVKNAGIYHLAISDKKGNLLKTIPIIKQ